MPAARRGSGTTHLDDVGLLVLSVAAKRQDAQEKLQARQAAQGCLRRGPTGIWHSHTGD